VLGRRGGERVEVRQPQRRRRQAERARGLGERPDEAARRDVLDHRDVLAAGWKARGRRRTRLRAALAPALTPGARRRASSAAPMTTPPS
jgi:hypothetical protein